ncbi:MAG: ATP-binding protein, partial [Clostridiales bacterium]|nr:ATP-binding protein [Clostridiales bacterium]
CRQASAQDQLRMMGGELSAQFGANLQNPDYDELFNHLKSKGSAKMVVIIDEAQFLMKKDEEFLKSVIKLRMKRLYPGPVLIMLASSSIVWVEQDLEGLFGEDAKHIDSYIKVEELNFLEVVRSFKSLPVSECVKIYGAVGGVQGYISKWNPRVSFKDNICRLILTKGGRLFDEAEAVISTELRELSVYNTILSAIARGYNKLNDLYLETGFSRAKISVYMKNLSHFDIIEKVVSFETSGWDNAKKGVYQIKDTFVNFWFKFVFPYQSDLFTMEPSDFYDAHIAKDLDEYLNRYFRSVCTEYLMLLNQMGELPFAIHKVGTWVGKTGAIDIIAQSDDRQNLVGFCNWEKPVMTMQMCEEMAELMDKAKIKSDHYYLFSATAFEPELEAYVKKDKRFRLIDMNEL